MSFSTFLTVDQSCSSALQWVNKQLTAAGVRAMRTFDLNDARPNSHDCSCPTHGTEHCDCQMMILLEYRSSSAPIPLILHGNNGKTWLSLENTIQHTSPLADQTQKVLVFTGSAA